MCADYKTKSRNADFEQHSNKIFTAIREIKPEYAEKRAIWELFQNALDVTEQNGEIKIIRTTKGLKFQHNGKPFNDGNLTGLIKQTSNGKTYGSNEGGVGQYGTGFLSTHVYGKEILLNASVINDQGKIKVLNDFKLDRLASTPDELKKKLEGQDDLAAEICDGENHIIHEHLPFTSFEYIANDFEQKSIDRMLEYIHDILPYIFVFNNKLSSVEIVINTETKYHYKKGTETSNSTIIFINNQPLRIEYLFDEQRKIKVVLPNKGLDFRNVPKLFLFYPLMETDQLGINFLIHSSDFKPNKERDYLHLEESNREIENDVKENKEILIRAFNLVKQKITSDFTTDLIPILDLQMNHEENPFIRDQKKELIYSFLTLERIKIGDDSTSLSKIFFMSEAFLIHNESDLIEIYNVIQQFYQVPDFDLYLFLSRQVANWKNDQLKQIGFKELLEEIYNGTNGYYLKISNKNSYKRLIQLTASDIPLLNSIPCIPNIHSRLKTIGQVVKWRIKEPLLVQIMDSINAKCSEVYLHDDFYYLENISNYDREKFKDDLNKLNNDLTKELNERSSLNPNSVKFYELIKYLTKYIGFNKSTDLNDQIESYFCNFYALQKTVESITSPTVELTYDSSFKLLARLHIQHLKTLEKAKISKLQDQLSEFVGLLNSNYELRTNLLDKLECFPNELFELKAQTELKIDDVKDELFKTKFEDITKKPVRSNLVLPSFEKYLSHSNKITGQYLGSDIEFSLNKDKQFIPIPNDPETLKIVYELINHLSKPDSKWGNWLPNIDKVKEEILLSKFKDETTRSSLLQILSGSEKKIKSLGELAKIEDLDALINAGIEKLKEKRRQEDHRNHINNIGLLIQNMVEEKLNKELAETIKIINSKDDANLKTQEQQGGQDFIIYFNSKPIYYIEVKSRWDSDGIVALSKRQVERCSENPDKYAVITVNVAEYKRNKTITIEENIQFEELVPYSYVNLDLSDNFKKLIQENLYSEKTLNETRLIEFRGHIPQERIRNTSVDFNTFIKNLKVLLENLKNE